MGAARGASCWSRVAADAGLGGMNGWCNAVTAETWCRPSRPQLQARPASPDSSRARPRARAKAPGAAPCLSCLLHRCWHACCAQGMRWRCTLWGAAGQCCRACGCHSAAALRPRSCKPHRAPCWLRASQVGATPHPRRPLQGPTPHPGQQHDAPFRRAAVFVPPRMAHLITQRRPPLLLQPLTRTASYQCQLPIARMLLPPGEGRLRCTSKFGCPACDRNRANDTGAYYCIVGTRTTLPGPTIRGCVMHDRDPFPPLHCPAAAHARHKRN